MLTVSTQIAPEDNLTVFKHMLQSVSFAGEIVIFNLGRSDLKNLQPRGVKIVSVKTPRVVEEIRARQVKEARGDWVLVMDYDEVVTPALKREILSSIASTSHSAYALSRRNFSLGYPLRHGGWGQDNVIRLFRREDFLSWPPDIHSTPTFNGSLGQLKHPLEHHKDESLTQMIEKTNRYSQVEAQLFFEGGLPPVTILTLIRKPVMEFVRRYFFKLGFLDGAIGLLQGIYQSYSVFITYAKLYEKQKSKAVHNQ